jgi:hypothetical protein
MPVSCPRAPGSCGFVSDRLWYPDTAGVAPAVAWAQVACLVTRRRAARIRSAVTASAAVSSAAPAAIRAICQPGVPPMTTVWIAGGARLWFRPGWVAVARRERRARLG